MEHEMFTALKMACVWMAFYYVMDLAIYVVRVFYGMMEAAVKQW